MSIPKKSNISEIFGTTFQYLKSEVTDDCLNGTKGFRKESRDTDIFRICMGSFRQTCSHPKRIVSSIMPPKNHLISDSAISADIQAGAGRGALVFMLGSERVRNFINICDTL